MVKSGMAEAKFDVMRGLASYVTSKEKVSGITGIEMGITPKAEELASRMSKLVKEGVGPTERGMAKQEMVQEFGDRLIALHAEDQIHSVSELMVWLNANQPDATKTMTSDELGLVQLAYDTKDGVALAMVANTGDNLDAKLKGVMWGRGNSGAKVEKELGFDKGPSTVLEGLGNEVLKTAITDKDLVVVLKKLGIGMNVGNVGAIRESIISVGKMFDKDPDSVEVNMVYEYLNAMQAGADAERFGGGRRRVPLVPKMGPPGAEGAEYGTDNYEAPFHVTKEDFVGALRDGGQVRWESSDPPTWGRHLEEKNPDRRRELANRDYFRNRIHNGAEWNLHFENDFTKIRTNPEYFMNSDELNNYFNGEAKLAGHMILKDLMRFYQKKNGVTMMVFDTSVDGITINQNVQDRIKHRSIYTDEIALRLAMYREIPRLKNESESEFLKRIKRESNKWFERAVPESAPGGTIPKLPDWVTDEDKMTSYSMQELFFIFHVYSQADKDRMFTPTPRQIQDKQRYMIWPEYKMARKAGAIGKRLRPLEIGVPGEIESETGQYKAEPVTPLQIYAQYAMDLEEVIGGPADGRKTVAEKIYDGDIVLGPENMMMSFLDLLVVNTKEKGKRTLSEALFYDLDFEFPNEQVDAMADCRDTAEQCDDAWKYFKGEVPWPSGKKNEMNAWVSTRNKVFGLTRSLNQNGKPIFTDLLRDPKVVAALMYCSRGVDSRSIAIGYPVLDGAIDNSTYATMVDYGVDAMKLVSDWANPREVKNVLLGKGVSRQKMSILAGLEQNIRLLKKDFRYEKLMKKYENQLTTLQRRDEPSYEDLELNRLYAEAKRLSKVGNREELGITLNKIRKYSLVD